MRSAKRECEHSMRTKLEEKAGSGDFWKCVRGAGLTNKSRQSLTSEETTQFRTSASLEVEDLKWSWIRHTRDWHIRGDVGRRSVPDYVARVAETTR